MSRRILQNHSERIGPILAFKCEDSIHKTLKAMKPSDPRDTPIDSEDDVSSIRWGAGNWLPCSIVRHVLCSLRLRDAPVASSSRLENPAVAMSSHISAGMLSRWSHDLTVVMGRFVSSTIRS